MFFCLHTKYSIVFLCILNPFFITRAHTISFMDKLKINNKLKDKNVIYNTFYYIG